MKTANRFRKCVSKIAFKACECNDEVLLKRTIMPLSEQQISSLLYFVATVERDPIDCDDCYRRLAEFAEAKIREVEIPQALRAIEVHLRQCPCCKKEYESLLHAMRSLEFPAES